jgi:hypothetical protein
VHSTAIAIVWSPTSITVTSQTFAARRVPSSEDTASIVACATSRARPVDVAGAAASPIPSASPRDTRTRHVVCVPSVDTEIDASRTASSRLLPVPSGICAIEIVRRSMSSPRVAATVSTSRVSCFGAFVPSLTRWISRIRPLSVATTRAARTSGSRSSSRSRPSTPRSPSPIGGSLRGGRDRTKDVLTCGDGGRVVTEVLILYRSPKVFL